MRHQPASVFKNLLDDAWRDHVAPFRVCVDSWSRTAWRRSTLVGSLQSQTSVGVSKLDADLKFTIVSGFALIGCSA